LVKTKDRPTVGNLKMAEPSANPAASQTSSPLSTMINNIWINRAAAIVLLLCIYAAGQDSGYKAHHNHPACHQNLKP